MHTYFEASNLTSFKYYIIKIKTVIILMNLNCITYYLYNYLQLLFRIHKTIFFKCLKLMVIIYYIISTLSKKN